VINNFIYTPESGLVGYTYSAVTDCRQCSPKQNSFVWLRLSAPVYASTTEDKSASFKRSIQTVDFTKFLRCYS